MAEKKKTQPKKAATKAAKTAKATTKPKAKPKSKPVAQKETVVCSDRNCVTHNGMSVRGRTFTGLVISDKMTKTVRVEWPRRHYLQKYERFEKRRTRVMAHNPECINAKSGDRVLIGECRPLSKTKNFVVLEVLK